MCKLWVFVFYTSLGLPNLNTKEKTKWILVLEVKRRHRANGLFTIFLSVHWVKLCVTACFAKNLVMNRITASGQQAVNLFILRYPYEMLAWNKTVDLSSYIWKKSNYWSKDSQAIKSNFSLPLIRIFFTIIFKTVSPIICFHHTLFLRWSFGVVLWEMATMGKIY